MKQRGFLLVILGAAAVWIVQLSVSSQRQASFSLEAAQAYYAASSGLEWGAYQAISASACPPTTTFSFTQGGLNGYSVTVNCTSNSYSEEGNTFNQYYLTATGSIGTIGTAYYAASQQDLKVTDAP